MNVRKPVDYGTMYRELTAILTQNLSQMDEVYAIGKAISQRPEKGAAVAAAEFLQANFPDRAGFSPRNVRRMRDFYKTYENDQKLLRLAMKIGWTLNVVIMEAELTSEARKWYLKQARERQWSKKELLDILSSGFEPDTEADHENSSLRFSESCGIINQKMKEQPLSHLAIHYRKPCKCEPFGLHSGSDQGTGWICCLLRYAGRRTGLYGVYGERTQRKSDDVSVEKARQYRCSVAGLQDFAFHT